MQAGEMEFAGVVVAAIVETEGEGDAVLVFVEHGGGVQAAGEDDDAVFHCNK